MSLSALAKEGWADSDGVPTTVAPVNKKCKRNDNSNRDLMMASIATEFKGLKEAQFAIKDAHISKTIMELRGQSVQYMISLQSVQNEDVRKCMKDAMDEIEEQIEDLKAMRQTD